MRKLKHHLGHLRAEVKAYLADRLSLAYLRAPVARLIDAIFPHQILPSHAPQSDLMPEAAAELAGGAGLDRRRWSRLHFLDHDGCEMCARPFDGGLWLGEGALCRFCSETPFPFGRARAACLYDDASKALILGFKHGDRLDLAPMLTRWIERAGADILAEADLIMPVPLHPLRLLHRRYNQAAELARPVARHVRRPYLAHALRRTRMTNQRGKGAQARWENVRGAFALSPDGQKRVAGRRVVLIDDVFTTGATLKACALELLRHGAASVDVCVLARAVPAEAL
ncbi:ComF family protein [Asticcacaulis sp. EMRT-3]|uniref:ComF family protein n=1 Tax=Asticcacaulis sp. EMRT-3 TaxID=3040349 RepID=UPI0024AF315F|nr:ComF family protein [Asticcacaulis sp. EMRT-3]MDI7775335.1 ComF family protein [Asticcacaulis sp. EMRT-3]